MLLRRKAIEIVCCLVFIFFSNFKVHGQGNRGVVINNQKVDDYNNIEVIKSQRIGAETTISAPLYATPKKMTTNNYSPINIDRIQPSTQATNALSFNLTFNQFIENQQPTIHQFFGVEQILKKNNSDALKLEQIIQKLNKTGILNEVNIFNVSSSIALQQKTTQKPLRPAIHRIQNNQKDPKELKVQFVLDCDLKDAMHNNNNPNVNSPTRLKQPQKQMVRYPNPNYASAFNQRVPVATPSFIAQPSKIYYAMPTKPAINIKRITTPKPKVKTVYVDPPGVAAVSNVLDGVYSYFEDALTTKVVKKDPLSTVSSKRNKHRNQIRKRSTNIDKILQSTKTPILEYTKSHDEKNQKLTTQIHVTSEFVGQEPTPLKQNKQEEYDDSESDEYDFGGGSYDDGEDDRSEYENQDEDLEEDEDESDEYDYEYDDEDNESEVNYVEQVPNKINVYKSEGVKQKKSKKRRKHSTKSESSENEEEYNDGFSMPNMGTYFRNTYNTISNFVPSFAVFGGDYDDDDDSVERKKLRKPKLKKSTYFNRKKPLSKVVIQEKNNNRWYDKFFFGSESDEEVTTAIPITKITTEPGFFSWFSSSEEETTASSNIQQHSKPLNDQQSGWFSNLFTNTEATTKIEVINDVTTSKPSTTISPKNQLLAMLATQMTAITRPSMNKTSIQKRVKYNDFQIWRLMPSTQAQLEYLKESKESDEFDKIYWLKGPAMRGPNDILVSPDMNKEIQEFLEYESIPFEVVIWDLEKAIKYENPIMSRRQKIELEKEQGHPMTWFRYHNFEDIAIYLDYLQLTYPNIVELIHIGRSFEGRPLIVAKISLEGTESDLRNNKRKASLKTRRRKKILRPGVFIEAGVHGREWITPAVATWILKELVKLNSTEDGNTEKEIARSVDWYILPVSNPDSYEFSLNYDRFWRKTRSKHPDRSSVLKLAMKWFQPSQENESPICQGTDPSHNYDNDWQKYGSTDACSEFYVGPKPFSEPETRALSNFLNENKNEISLFISLHSYGQFIAYPSTVNTSYGATQKSNDLRDIAEIAINSIRDLASSARYSVDNTNEMSYLNAGSSTDYAMHKVGIKYSYTIEVRDTGTQGFLLSPSYIDSSGLEIYEMIKSMVEYI